MLCKYVLVFIMLPFGTDGYPLGQRFLYCRYIMAVFKHGWSNVIILATAFDNSGEVMIT